ncbi:hypothetical protein KUV57_12780 [Epibacterium sp. DP7N7-1]|nr:hypothetical protein [Epibacterium sp. DP7N7-1]
MRDKFDIYPYLRDVMRQGGTAESARKGLIDAGWSSQQIETAFSAWHLVPGLPPIPRARPSIRPGEALVQAIGFTALAMIAIFTVRIGFGLAEILTPGIGQTGYRSGPGRWSVAMLIVFLPVFAMVHLRVRPGATPQIRRWLAAFSGFLASMALLSAGAAAVHSFLSGDLNLRFALKMAIVFLSATLAYFTYRAELSDGRPSRKAPEALACLSVLAILAGLTITGGPAEGRAEVRDAQRRSDISALSIQAQCLARDGFSVPPIGVSSSCPNLPPLNDPLTGDPYGITTKEDGTLRVCAIYESRQYNTRPNPDDGCLTIRLMELDEAN